MEILIIEDEKDLVESIEYNFKKEGYRVSKAFDGVNGLRLAKEKIPSLIILDLMLPGVSGLEVCRELKRDPKTSLIPVVMLTAKTSEADRVVGLELGADDYISKPFSMRELVARVKAILRRYGKKEEEIKPIIKSAEVEIDVEKHQVKVGNRPVELTAKEFELLRYLVENAEKVFSRERLLDRVWEIDAETTTRTVDVHIRRLRSKLGKAAKHLVTLRGVGYKWTSS